MSHFISAQFQRSRLTVSPLQHRELLHKELSFRLKETRISNLRISRLDTAAQIRFYFLLNPFPDGFSFDRRRMYEMAFPVRPIPALQ